MTGNVTDFECVDEGQTSIFFLFVPIFDLKKIVPSRVDPGSTREHVSPGRPRVDPGTKFVNFRGFSKILKEVMILQDPDPQKLLHINTPDKVMKKLTFYHGSCD